MIYGTFSFAIVLNILLSNEPPEISFIIWAPELTDSSATLLLYVSTEIIAFGNLFDTLSTAFITRLNSSETGISLEPGLDVIPPISINVAPSFNIFSTCIKYLSEFKNFPPS